MDRSVPACVRLNWLGRSDVVNPALAICPFFEQVLSEASADACFIDMHFEALEHFNSATCATLIQLLYAAGNARVPLHIVYGALVSWQARAFEAIQGASHSFGSGEWPKVEFFAIHS